MVAEQQRAGILGYGHALAGTTVTSDEVAARYDLTAEWIIDRTGVESRRVLDVDAGAIDLVIVATITPDNLFPAQAVVVADAVGVPPDAIVYDLSAACTGFVTALSQAAGAIESGRAKYALVIGADALSRITPHDDPKSAPLFGDAAGAVVVGATAAGGIGPAIGGFDHQHRILYSDRDDGNVIRMRGRETYSNAVARMSEVILKALETRDATLDDVALLVPHQANIRIVQAVGEKLGIGQDRVSVQIADVGNTSAASIPVALSREYAAGRLAGGGLIAMAGFGGGFAYSAITAEIEGIAP